MGAASERSSLLAHELQGLSGDGGRSIYSRSRAEAAAMIPTGSSRSGIVMIGSEKKRGRLIRPPKRRRRRRRMINMNGILEKRVRRLRKLVPKKRAEHDDDEEVEEESRGLALAGLFGETAEYIMCLQVKVKLMQAMVNLLSSCDG